MAYKKDSQEGRKGTLLNMVDVDLIELLNGHLLVLPFPLRIPLHPKPTGDGRTTR